MPETSAVSVSRDGPVATVTMCRPEVHNAFNEALIAELHEAFIELGRDASVRVIVLAGEGKSFSVGADINWMKRMGEASEEQNRLDAWRLARMLGAVAYCAKPVIARVHGAALGGGAGLTAAADVAVAADAAVFGFAEVRLGIIPATIGPYVIEKIGAGRALPLFLTAERIAAQRAYEIGLVHRVVPDEALDAAVGEIVDLLLAGGPAAQAQCKRLVRRIGELQRQDVDFYTSETISAIRATPEAKEGLAAFLEKRQPEWAP